MGQELTIEEYKKKYKLSYETARQDIMFMDELGILSKEGQGRKFVYTVVNDFNVLKDYIASRKKD